MLFKPTIILVATVVLTTMLVSPLGAKTAEEINTPKPGAQIIDQVVIHGDAHFSANPKGDKTPSSAEHADLAAKIPALGKMKTSFAAKHPACGKEKSAAATEVLDPSWSQTMSKPGTKPVDQRKMVS